MRYLTTRVSTHSNHGSAFWLTGCRNKLQTRCGVIYMYIHYYVVAPTEYILYSFSGDLCVTIDMSRTRQWRKKSIRTTKHPFTIPRTRYGAPGQILTNQPRFYTKYMYAETKPPALEGPAKTPESQHQLRTNTNPIQPTVADPRLSHVRNPTLGKASKWRCQASCGSVRVSCVCGERYKWQLPITSRRQPMWSNQCSQH